MSAHEVIVPSLRAGGRRVVHTTAVSAGVLSNLKKLIFVATLLLALVGGAGQASADPGKGHSFVNSAGVTWESNTNRLNAGVTWE